MQSGSTPNAQDKFDDLVAPTAEDLSYQLEELVQQGVISPEDAQAALVGRSEMDNVAVDPSLKKAQTDALLGLQDISDSGGMTAMDKANLARIANDEATQSRGAREAIIQNANARGMGGSGLELMAQMQNQQDSASRRSQRDLDVAGQAQARALEALMQGGTLAGNIRGQDFSEQSQAANANDAIARFNAQNQQAVNMANTQARNQAQAANVGMKQDIANANVGTRNQQNAQSAQVKQQMFNNEIAKRGGQQQVANQNAMAQGQNSQNQANAWNQTVGTAIGAGATMYGKKDGGMVGGDSVGYDGEPHLLESGEFVVRREDVPEFLKKAHTDDKGDFDAAGFLDAITGHKYAYKKGKK